MTATKLGKEQFKRFEEQEDSGSNFFSNLANGGLRITPVNDKGVEINDKTSIWSAPTILTMVIALIAMFTNFGMYAFGTYRDSNKVDSASQNQIQKDLSEISKNLAVMAKIQENQGALQQIDSKAKDEKLATIEKRIEGDEQRMGDIEATIGLRNYNNRR